ncbi:MAG: flagellar hook-basal body protein [Planctomycetaceae bacterium]|nr:flagellar hook-basal body protein [Planctomycetaceae bacterium]
MIYGLYLSAQGAETQALRQAVLANNLANAQTTAFKPDVPVFQAHLPFDAQHQQATDVPPTIDDQTGGVSLAATVTNFTQGPLQVTNRPLDVAVMGPGFLQVGTPNGPLLTRNGQLAMDVEGRLTTQEGHPLHDVAGQPIVIPEGFSQIDITGDGMVSAVDPGGVRETFAQVGLYEPNDIRLMTKEGDSFYRPLDGVRPAVNGQLRQGILEQSNADPVHGMVELIETSRAFEMNMNLVKYQDEMLGQLIQSVQRK